MDFKTAKINDIIEWCKANDQVAWLKAEITKEKEYKQYPRKKVYDEEKKKYVYVADKSKEPKIKKQKIGFIDLKLDFFETFFPELAPKKEAKKPNMYDIIEAL